MICDSCRRQVDYVRESFWLGGARICRECFAQWCDPDNDRIETFDAASIGNYVRLKHGLPPLAASLALILAIAVSTAHASRHCLSYAEAGRTWPVHALVKDGDGCWTYDRQPTTAAPATIRNSIMPAAEPVLMDRWPDENLLWVELREFESESAAQAEPVATRRPIALMVALVLATVSVVSVATGWRKETVRVRPALWPRQAEAMAATKAGKPLSGGAIRPDAP